MDEGQNDDPAPRGSGPEWRAVAPPTGTGPQDRGPSPSPQPPTRRGTREERTVPGRRRRTTHGKYGHDGRG